MHACRRPQLGRDVRTFIRSANEEVLLLVQVETMESYEDLDQVRLSAGQTRSRFGVLFSAD